jgi:hypothetical protein
MSVRAVCTGCQKTFNAPDELAGKKVRCKHCGTAFRVPGGATARANAAASSAAPVAKRSAPAATAVKRSAPAKVANAAPVAIDVDDDQGEYGLAGGFGDDDAIPAVAPARPYTPTALAAAPAYAAPAHAASRGTMATMYPTTGSTVAARFGGAAPSAGPNWVLWVQAGAIGLPLLLLLVGKLIPAMATVGILMASFIGMGFMLWGQIGILIAAAQEGSFTLLLYLFLPVYPLYFILTHLDDIMPSLLRTVAGIALIIGAVMMILSQSPK